MKKISSCALIMMLLLQIAVAAGCSGTQKEKELSVRQKELELKEKELALKEHEQQMPAKAQLSTEEAVKLAEKQFREYLPKIEASHNGAIDLLEPHTGDFTGDGIEDVAIYFSLSPKDGGNALVGQGLSLYQNTGTAVKVVAGYEPDYLFSFSRISRGRIYVEKLEYADGDGRCCPSIKEEKVLTINGTSVY